MLKFIVISLISFSAHAYEVESLWLSHEKGVGSNRSVYFNNEERSGTTKLGFDLRALDVLYNSTQIEGTLGASQYRHVGLATEAGLDFYRAQIYFNHKSDHNLDQDWYGAGKKYGNTNSVGLRIFLIRDGR